jgi:hypothetical protein
VAALLVGCGATSPTPDTPAPGEGESAELGGLVVFDPPVIDPPSVEAAAKTKARGDAAFVDGKVVYRGATAGLVIGELEDEKLLERSVVYLPGAGNDVLLVGSVAFVACGSAGVVAVDVSSIADPVPVAAVDTAGSALRLSLVGDALIVADGATGVAVIDVSTPAKPRPRAVWRSAGYVRQAIAVGEVIYVAEGRAGISKLRLEAGALEHVWRHETAGQARAVALHDGMLLVADGPSGLALVDPGNGGAPVEIGRLALDDMARDVATSGDRAFVATGDDGVIVVDVSKPDRPARTGEFVPEKPANRLRIVERRIYVGNDSDGLLVLDIADPDRPQKVFPPAKEEKAE